jgi:hypothetical protein
MSAGPSMAGWVVACLVMAIGGLILVPMWSYPYGDVRQAGRRKIASCGAGWVLALACALSFHPLSK